MISVFLVDDHAILRDGLRMILETQPDIRVIGEAADGRDAVRRMPQIGPDVAIVDIGMPGLNGVEAIAQLRPRCPNTRFVVLSMHANQEYVARALQAGALGYVLKEATAGDVIADVRAAYAGHRFLSDKIALLRTLDLNLQPARPLEGLSEREREVLQLIVEGNSSAEIAGALGLSPKTVETYRSRLMRKLEIRDLPALVKFAILHGFTTLQ